MTTTVDDFVARARAVTIAEAAARLGLRMRGRAQEHPQACPACGGKDTFAFNTAKDAWNCRRGGAGGHDAIGMAAHVLGLDVRRRDGFLEACAAASGESIPEGGERESDADRAARLARLEAQRRSWLEEQAGQERAADDFRAHERAKARGKFEAALPIEASPVQHYLLRRVSQMPITGNGLRFLPAEPYWFGEGPDGRPAAIHEGPAMVAPFVDAEGHIIGCHLTWIDLLRAPKFRPVLYALTAEGLRAGRPEWGGVRSDAPPAADIAAGLYEVLPSKKMRGSKKGGLIPLIGFVWEDGRIRPSRRRRRMVVGEGIETVLAVAISEWLREDTIYAAAGDLGNMAGPAASRFAHPTLTRPDRHGRPRPVLVPGPDPLVRPHPEPAEGFSVPAHVDRLVLLGDGDSERVMTSAAMARAKARLARPGLAVSVAMAPDGQDFVDVLTGAA